jgi:hypothetical protein
VVFVVFKGNDIHFAPCVDHAAYEAWKVEMQADIDSLCEMVGPEN